MEEESICKPKHFDVFKVVKGSPENVYQAIDLMNEAQQDLLRAILIMSSVLDYPEDIEFHKKSINIFLNKFK